MSREELSQDLWQAATGKTTDKPEWAFIEAYTDDLADALTKAGWRKIAIDDATVERASEVLLGGDEWCECRRSPFDKHDVNPPCSTRTWARQAARAVLAAAVEADQ